ncbi:MAG TPA: choice-of-anchor D domain-containing protein, partial [Bacteroidota bacterium]|nr:choice-of-anchor D domain-containing protein [Bacteroidota bacterium]
MRRSITVLFVLGCAMLLCTASASAQLLIEDFNYTSGTALTANGWSAHSGAGTLPEMVTATGLSYTGYASSNIGNAATLDSTGQDVNKTWASYPNGITSGNIYYSFLVNLTTAKSAGDYFFHFFKNSTTFGGRVFAKKASNGNICFGVSKASTNIVYTDSIYSLNTTYLIALKYSIIAGTTNDTVALWVNPAIGSTEPAPTLLESTADRTGADLDTIYGIAIRQGTAANAPKGTVDGIRVGTTWATSVGGTLLPQIALSQTNYNFGSLNVGTSLVDSITIQNNNAYGTLSISSITSSKSVFTVSAASATISPSSSQKIAVTYLPTAVAMDSAYIILTSNDPTSPDTIRVFGAGVQAGFSASQTSITYGKVFKDSTVI